MVREVIIFSLHFNILKLSTGFMNSLEKDNHLQVSETPFPQELNKDPALWLIDEFTRDYLALHGYDQNKNGDFAKSKRHYNDYSR